VRKALLCYTWSLAYQSGQEPVVSIIDKCFILCYNAARKFLRKLESLFLNQIEIASALDRRTDRSRERLALRTGSAR